MQVVNTETDPWETRFNRATDAVVAALEELYSNATAYNQTTCVCTNSRMLGWTPHLVMVARTGAPTAFEASLPPTAAYTYGPTKAPTASTTLAPTAAPTAPTDGPTAAPTTLAPTPPDAPIPLVPEMCASGTFALCTDVQSSEHGTVACTAAAWSGDCSTVGTCQSFTSTGTENNVCGGNTVDDYPVHTPNAFPGMSYRDCTQFYQGVAGVCVTHAPGAITGYPVMYYCRISNTSGFPRVCAASYACTASDETFYGATGVDRTTDACYTETSAPVTPTLSPVPAAGTAAPTHEPTTTPTAHPTSEPTAKPTMYYPYVVNPDNTVREFWPAYDSELQYVWQYRLRGPFGVVDTTDTLELYNDNESDVLWPSDARCNAEPGCRALGAVDYLGTGVADCEWLCVQIMHTDQSVAPLIVRASLELNISQCALPGYVYVNTRILSSFLLSQQWPALVEAVVNSSTVLASAMMWTPWMNLTSRSDYNASTCSGDIGGTGCRASLEYHENYTAWYNTRSLKTQWYLDNTSFPELKQANVPRLYPDIELVYDTSITYGNNHMRVWQIMTAYQTATRLGLYACENVTLNAYGVSSARLKVGVVSGGDPFAVCGSGQVCKSLYNGHSACNTISDPETCAAVPLCTVCVEVPTDAPTAFVPATLPPTPTLVNPSHGNVDTKPLVGVVSGIVVVVAIVALITAIVTCIRLHDGTLVDDDESKDPLLTL